jgi:hypothetical protein
MAKQVQKEYDCNNNKMVEYLIEVRRMEKFFDGFEVWYIPRLDNWDADHLAWIASSRVPIPPDVIIEKLTKPLVDPTLMSLLSHPVLRPNQMLIVFMPRNQVYTHTILKMDTE